MMFDASLGLYLKKLKAFRWLPGMLVSDRYRIGRVTSGLAYIKPEHAWDIHCYDASLQSIEEFRSIDFFELDHYWVSVHDAGTKGCLLALCRELQGTSALWFQPLRGKWQPRHAGSGPRDFCEADTEIDSMIKFVEFHSRGDA